MHMLLHILHDNEMQSQESSSNLVEGCIIMVQGLASLYEILDFIRSCRKKKKSPPHKWKQILKSSILIINGSGPSIWEGFSREITNRLEYIQLKTRLTRIFLYSHWQHSDNAFRIRDSSTLNDSRAPLSTHSGVTVSAYRNTRTPVNVYALV